MDKPVRFVLLALVVPVMALELPGSCKSNEYYDPNELACQSCAANVSMVPAADGFSCVCEDHSIPSGIAQCRVCNVTAVVSSDRLSCVPRRCQTVAGRIVCRKCPSDYIYVTQNFDGSPMKEMLCVKCARGHRAENNVCVRCESCTCGKHEIVVRGRCLPKRFVNERPKHEETKMHPFTLLDIVKYEYLCIKNDLHACRSLAGECVRYFYTTDLAGPCRLWVQPRIAVPKSLPQLTLDASSNDKSPGEIGLTRGMHTLDIAVIEYTLDGGVRILSDSKQQWSPCFLPLKIFIGRDYSADCKLNVSTLEKYTNETFAPFLYSEDKLQPLPVTLRKPNEQYVRKNTWPSNNFRRYFVMDTQPSYTLNITNTVYLRSLLIHLRIDRDKSKPGSLRVRISVEAQYATKSAPSQTVTLTLKVEHEMPSAGIVRGLEVWGGVLGALLSLYAIIQWRGQLRRGGLQISLIPALAGSISDSLYFAALFSTLHALAAEAGNLGMTLPLSRSEDYMIRTFVYSAISLKALKVAWINWSQCQCDMFFLDWSEYNPPLKLDISHKSNIWRVMTLAKEWSSLQTLRRASPAFTVTLALIILQLLSPWQAQLPKSQGYHWAVTSLSWWSAYVVVLLSRWVMDKALGSPIEILPKVCTGVGMTLIVFEQEYYAHCVHGRNHDSDTRSMAGSLETCRLVCAPQLRKVYKQLSASTTLGALGEIKTRQALLSRFLAAFFERALDGLSWVASQRTMLERLLDIELVEREAGTTSILLYDADDKAPSCFAVTWWGEEWSLGTLDAMVFGCIVIATGDRLLSALVTVTAWQILKHFRSWFGNKNQREKTDVEIIQ